MIDTDHLLTVLSLMTYLVFVSFKKVRASESLTSSNIYTICVNSFPDFRCRKSYLYYHESC